MPTVTLEQINKNIVELRKEVSELKGYFREDFELADDVKKEIQESRKRDSSHFVRHEDAVKRYS